MSSFPMLTSERLFLREISFNDANAIFELRTNPQINKALKITGLLSIGWSKRSFDTTGLSEKSILQRVTKNLRKGDIILLHDSSSKSILVLEQLLLFLKTNKLESVTVDQLLAIKPYA